MTVFVKLRSCLFFVSVSHHANGFNNNHNRFVSQNSGSPFIISGENERRRSTCSGVDVSLSGGAVVEKSSSSDHLIRKRGRHFVPITTSLVVGFFSVLEIVESSREFAERRLGHAHGIGILVFLRLCRSVAIFQTQLEEFEEQVKEIGEEVGVKEKNIPILSFLGRLIVSPVVTISACLLAMFTCLVEIFDDMKPGAHHGSALLALSEFYYQICRFMHFRKNRRKGNKMSIAPIKATRISIILSKIPIKALISLAAGGFALLELYEDMQPGAHHGVAVLALADFVENVNRSKIIH